jgi:hypothetical protein
MALYIFITENCRDSAKRHGVLTEVDNFKDRVEKAQKTNSLDRFGSSPYLVKQGLGKKQGRLITELKETGDDEVLVFHAFMIRGEHEFDSFRRDPMEYGAKNLAGAVKNETLFKYVLERSQKEPVTEKNPFQ